MLPARKVPPAGPCELFQDCDFKPGLRGETYNETRPLPTGKGRAQARCSCASNCCDLATSCVSASADAVLKARSLEFGGWNREFGA
jgi:hypothetical protein